jgi:conjugative relaxase-like TrwC/TraI family protein
MTAASGFRYLMESVAVGDGRADQSSPLTRYYAESGTPPGRFAGGGLSALGLAAGEEVTEMHLSRMLVEMVDPASGELLGRQAALRPPPSLEERVQRRLDRLPEAERATAREQIEIEEKRRTQRVRAPVAAFDLTFSPSKSISTVWAVADEGTKAVIYQCHLRAIAYTLGWAERHAFHSRSGKGGVVQEDIEGVVAAAFTHYDTRAGDPQLHDHVVVWNRAQSTSDGEWRTLDSRGLFKSVVTLSEIHQGVLFDMLTVELGVGWEGGGTRNGMRKHEVTGVPQGLIEEFSQRRRDMDRREDQLVAEFLAARGRPPTPVERRRIAQRANLETRQAKQHHSLAQLSEDWRQRAIKHVGTDPVAWVSTLRDRNDLPLLRADDLVDDMLAEVAALAVEWEAGRRSTFSRANVIAEVARQLEGVRFGSVDDRMAVIERTANFALGAAVQVTAPELHHTPQRYRRPDGTSRLRPADYHLYTTTTLLEAEQRLLTAARTIGGPGVGVAIVAEISEQDLPGRDYAMNVDQAVAVEKIATSGRYLDLLVGAAGTGKSTTMAGLRAVWETAYGPGSVIGLAPSAAAAEVLADELGIDTENTAKWLFEQRQNDHRRTQLAEIENRLGAHPSSLDPPPSMQKAALDLAETIERWELKPGQLVIVDEASLGEPA